MTRLCADWIAAPGTQTVMTMLTDAGHRALFVGGCVRNTVMGRPVADIDIATDARPEQVVARAAAAKLKAIPTGIDHGTVTVISGIPHEITTFRRDVTTDGRRATVAFANGVEEDAARRDFTMNALYAEADGTLLDPLGGLDDARAGRVRFIGRPEDRIAEDGLRVLRFFRFAAIYGARDEPLDPAAVAAIAGADSALDPVSRERIGGEVAKLLAAPDPRAAIAAMAETGVLAHVLPGADPAGLRSLVLLEQTEGVAPSWYRRLTALGPGSDWADALRLSRKSARRLTETRRCLAEATPTHVAAERFGRTVAEDAALVAAATGLRQLEQTWRDDIRIGAAARFPVRADDLVPPFEPGPALGAELDRLQALWRESRFALDKKALLARAGAPD